MLSQILLTSLLLHQVHFTATLYDCYYLRRICRIDPDCPDETAFYSKCQRTGPQTSLVLTYDGHVNNNNVGGISVYSLYQREALRESLYLLKEKLHQHNIEVREEVASNVDEHEVGEENSANIPLTHLSDSNRESGNKGEKLLTKYLISRNTASQVGGGEEGQEGKKDLIDKAFDLVQLLIKQHDTKTRLDNNDNKRSLNKEREELQTTNSEKRKVQVSTHEAVESADVEDFVNDDHFEVATPVYTEEDNLQQVRKGNPPDPEYQPQLHPQKQQQQRQQQRHNNLEQSEEILVNKRSNDGTLTLNASSPLSPSDAKSVGLAVSEALWNVTNPVLKLLEVNRNTATYALQIPPLENLIEDDIHSVVEKLNNDKHIHATILKKTGTNIVGAGVTSSPSPPPHKKKHWDKITLFSVIVGASVLLLLSVAIGVVVVKRKGNEFPPLNFRKNEVMEDYQELCRTKMSIVNSPHPEEQMDKKVEQQQQVSAVWGEDGSPYNMDITTGHVILNYMEDHLHDAERLNKEWEALCAYKADDSCTSVGSEAKHATKNRYRDVLPYDTKRVTLRESSNAFHSDYINASFITDTHPRTPAYIATQGPLDNTVGDFWQMVWEQGIVVIINLTKLSDMGLPQCHRYWPTDGSHIYHTYEVHLISEHIWCDDYLVRSLYLKNLNTCETRTVTQFHFVSWSHLSVPQSPTPLLEFRRKVNRCYRGSQCPVLVHCNNGVGRTGTYILLDLVLNRMLKGVKEIDIAATLEHLRDQRAGMVKTKQQFEFVLLATAQEVSTILDAVSSAK